MLCEGLELLLFVLLLAGYLGEGKEEEGEYG